MDTTEFAEHNKAELYLNEQQKTTITERDGEHDTKMCLDNDNQYHMDKIEYVVHLLLLG